MLEIDGTLLIAALSFVVFVFIMNIVFYRPILDIIEKRKQYLLENENKAGEMVREAQIISEKEASLLSAGKVDANNLLINGKKESDDEFAKSKSDFIKQQNEEYSLKHAEILQSGEILKENLQNNSGDISGIMKSKLFGGLNV